ncbi:MAG: hypothetical protein NTZ61_13795 [Proteobacteria bacterium]|nr:hypothetical protein [Pseudomonadota bacterium]
MSGLVFSAGCAFHAPLLDAGIRTLPLTTVAIAGIYGEAQLPQHASVEDEIQRELQRQEELLHQIDREQTTRDASHASVAPTEAEVAVKSDPRSAPIAPRLRELPDSVFDEKPASIPTPDGKGKRSVVARSLDADRDGHPEEVRYFDEKTKQLVRVEEDRDYDGRLDVWSRYEGGVLTERDLDENRDGKPDAWERYSNGRMVSREVDRDGKGVRDAFYLYQGDALVEERHDTKGSGHIDRIVRYQGRRLTRTEEDRDGNGQLDAWSTYALDAGGAEVVVRVERDTKGDGKPDVFEDFEQQGGKTVLTRREEDINQDGTADVISTYDKGKLVKREITDPSLMPL